MTTIRRVWVRSMHDTHFGILESAIWQAFLLEGLHHPSPREGIADACEPGWHHSAAHLYENHIIKQRIHFENRKT